EDHAEQGQADQYRKGRDQKGLPCRDRVPAHKLDAPGAQLHPADLPCRPPAIIAPIISRSASPAGSRSTTRPSYIGAMMSLNMRISTRSSEIRIIAVPRERASSSCFWTNSI